jgi:pimeloyl-ACP methyl ester carboxylesterase
MSPAIRLGDPDGRQLDAPPAEPINRLDRGRVSVGGIETRAVWSGGKGTPSILLHGWMDNADTWLEVLDVLAERTAPAVAYDQPGFGVAPPLHPAGDVLDQLTDFAEDAVGELAARSRRDVVVCGNSLGGWVALRLAERRGVPLAGVVLLGPAGIRMAPFFFTADSIPAVAQIISMPAPVPETMVRSISGRLYRALAFGDPAAMEQPIIDRFTRFMTDRAVIRERIDYAKRIRGDLRHPFDSDRIEVPVTCLWGERDRLCPVAGAEVLAEILPQARVEVLEGIGHTPQIECPELVADAIGELAR